MSNQNSPLKGFRQLKDSRTPSENPPNTPWKSPTAAPDQPPQELSSYPVTAPHQQMTICPYCSSPVPEGASFCIKCGNALPKTNPNPALSREIICPKCGTSNLPGSAYCSNCGTPISQSGPSKASFPNNASSLSSQESKKKDTKTEGFWILIAAIGMVVAFICFFLPFIKYDYGSPYFQYKYSISTYQMLDAMDDIRVLIIVLIISLFADIFLVYLAFTSKNQKLGQWMVISGILGIILVITGRVMVGKIPNIFESFEIFDYEINIPEIKFSTGFGFWGMLIGFFVFAFAGYMWRSSTD